MENENIQVMYGLGCQPSVMDGTEHEIDVDAKIQLPSSFNWREAMPPIMD